MLGTQVQGRPAIVRTDLRTGKDEVLVDNYQGKPLQGPNDITIDGKGRLYFTAREEVAVYRVDGPGKIERILSGPPLEDVNGIQVSPDDKTLYVVETHQVKNGHRRIDAADLAPDGTARNLRVHYDFRPGRGADGMSIDTQGNLYAAGGISFESTFRVMMALSPDRGDTDQICCTPETKGGVWVISPQGKLLKFIPVPEDVVTNDTFGGPDMKTLYITAGKTIFKVRTDIAGLPR